MRLEDSVITLKGVGQKTADSLAGLGIISVDDLLHYYPRDYDIYGLPKNIEDLADGETAAIECLVNSRPEMNRGSGRMLVRLKTADPTGTIEIIWFNSGFIVSQIKPGFRYIFRGRVLKKNKTVKLQQPAIFTAESYRVKLESLQPVYHLRTGVTNNLLSKLIREALPALTGQDYLKSSQLKQFNLIKQKDALEAIHFPESKQSCIDAHKRLAFDEFAQFLIRVRCLKQSRNEVNNLFIVNDFSICDKIVKNLKYALTSAQLKVLNEIKSDLSGKTAMSRMIQGDVGSGKTIVAILTMAAVVKAGYQCALMVPTDVLAKQHFDNINELLAPLGIRTSLLTGRLKGAEKKAAYEKISSHGTDIVVGTHALIQDKVKFDCLALGIIDEQHRFGVNQREALLKKGSNPHLIVMSATPIPRSLAIVLYGDLDISIIDEMPLNRLPIKNCVVGREYRNTAFEFIKKQVLEGRQAYIICPLIEESETTEAENVTDYIREAEKFFESTDIQIAALHGQMTQDSKDCIMQEFVSGSINVLVSTTVVEVGVNVPNATVMMIENAERFGLAQLHQLRGRVGRGEYQSYCIFMKGTDSEDINSRLDILVKYNDGMKIAEEDLKLRGPGDFFGTRQSGELDFGIASIFSDADVLKKATDYVNELEESDIQCFMRTMKSNLSI